MAKTPDYFVGKTIIVTGAASGIGKATALIFAREGASVVCADLIGDGCDALIPASPPRQALEARRQRADQEVRGGEYVHQIPREQPGHPP